MKQTTEKKLDLKKKILETQIWNEFKAERERNPAFNAAVTEAFYYPASCFTHKDIVFDFVMPMIMKYLKENYPHGVPKEKTPRDIFEDIVKECEERPKLSPSEPQNFVNRTDGINGLPRTESSKVNLDHLGQEEGDGHWAMRENPPASPKTQEKPAVSPGGWVSFIGSSLYGVGSSISTTVTNILSGEETNNCPGNSFSSLGE